MEIIKTLLDAGADPNVEMNFHRPNAPGRGRFGDNQVSTGTTALFRAVQLNDMEVINLLLAKGANPNINSMGYTPFGLAANNGPNGRGGGAGPVNLELLNLLAKHGADVNAKSAARLATPSTLATAIRMDGVNSKEGTTALHEAARAGRADLVRYLIDLGADPNLADNDGQKPIDVVGKLRGVAAANGPRLPRRRARAVPQARAPRPSPKSARFRNRIRKPRALAQVILSQGRDLCDNRRGSMQRLNRRQLLQSAGTALLTTWASRLSAQSVAVAKLTDKLWIVDGGGANIVALAADDGLILVDSGAPKSGDQVKAAPQGIGSNGKVTTLFNTHYHLDQTGNNEAFVGAKIIAHQRTNEWMATDYWVQAEDRYEKARPKGAQPTETFLTTGSMKSGAEQIDYGYLIMAHTSGDIYVHFKTQNVIAVGDVASPALDPALDYATGAWIGGRVDAMDTILKLADDQTKIVPAYGHADDESRIQSRARHDGRSPRAPLQTGSRRRRSEHYAEAGVLKGLPRTWRNPAKFLYDAAKGLWAHHDKLDANVV